MSIINTYRSALCDSGLLRRIYEFGAMMRDTNSKQNRESFYKRMSYHRKCKRR